VSASRGEHSVSGFHNLRGDALVEFGLDAAVTYFFGGAFSVDLVC
jgi:hypothetical protein